VATYVEEGALKLFARRRRAIAVLLTVVIALFVFRPGANGLRKRIVASISMALGRKVDVQWVKIRLLPTPGFDLENFVVYDDPAFSAEPMLRASEVTANLRLRSLFRGRLEIGRLSLKEPSFNLVRNDEGRWNLSSLIERAAHIPATPTSHTKPESRPVFPYIEAHSSRINFRIGAEKKSYALTDADFALWLESENQWGVRLRAVPVRTDYNLTDTGTLRVNGSWLRSETVLETPLKVSLEWDHAQLGQVTKLFYGTDKGWRGEITLSTVLSGKPANLQVNTQAAVQDFRRYDIVPSQSLRLATTCNANYSSADHVLSQIMCVSPVGDGSITLDGNIAAPTGPRTYDLAFTAQDVPIQSIISLARRTKKDLPDDLLATGTLSADVSARTVEKKLQWSGKAGTTDFRLHSNVTNTELALGTMPFELVSNSPLPVTHKPMSHQNKKLAPDTAVAAIGPLNVTMGKGHTVLVNGSITHSGYQLSLNGDAQVQRLLQVAQTLGVRAPQPAAEGDAKLDLQISGSWAGFAAPLTTGSVQLHSVRAEARGLNGPVQIESANILLADSGVRVSNLAAWAGGTRWAGSLSFPRQCSSLATCPMKFNLQADTIFFDRFHTWLSPQLQERPWYRFLAASEQPGPSLLLSLNASGDLTANRLFARGITGTRVSASVDLHAGKLQLSNIVADVLGGRHRGDAEADLAAKPPTYSGRGAFDGVLLGQLAAAMHDGWITGTGAAKYQFATTGNTSKDLLSKATATIDFDARGGELAHIKLDEDSGPLRVRRFTGRLSLQDGNFRIEQGKLDTPAGIYLVSGTASLGQKLDVSFARTGARGFNITGTLSSPRVLPATSETRAALKP
jgi:uncharacterized protein involved in outer membrane biogenesis